MTDIFISYAREDEDRIRPLVNALESQGWAVFWDRRIPAGQSWRSYIGKALSDASCVIVAWSHQAIGSSWVCDEADEGKQRGILVPVLLDPVEPPIGFRSIQAADLIDWRSADVSPPFERLLADISAMLKSPVTPPGARMRPGSDTLKWYKRHSKTSVWISVSVIVVGTMTGLSYLFFPALFPSNASQTEHSESAVVPADGAATEFPTLSLAPGSKGVAVWVIQQVLKDEGYFTGVPDGSYGPETRTAVAKYQSAHGMVADGILGIVTATKIMELRKKKDQP